MSTAALHRPAPRSRLESLFYAFGPFAALILLWELVRLLSHADPRRMPSLWSVLRAIGLVLNNGVLPDYIWRSVLRIGIAGALSIAVGVVLGIAIGISPTVASLFTPLLRFFSSLSGIAWLPLFLMWWGFNERTIVATIAYTFLFPVIFNTVTGVRTVPRVFRHAVLTMGGSHLQVISSVLLPGAMPSIIAGLRLGFGYGWRAVIAAEILVGSGGLGYMIFKAQASNLTDRILAGMVVIGVTWSVMDYFVLQPLEELTTRRWGIIQR